MSGNNIKQLLHGINPVPSTKEIFKEETVEDVDEEFIVERIIGKNHALKNITSS